MNTPDPVAFAGSRMHILDWIESRGSNFPGSLTSLLQPTGVVVEQSSYWRPKGYADAGEALLDRPCEPLLPPNVSSRLRSWWLAVDHPTASGPNWDLAAIAVFPGGLRGLVLIEAKAHAGEINNEAGGKRLRADPSADSVANHCRIAAAITEARNALGGPEAGVSIGRDRCYQFSNRVAFAWKLAAEGVPVVLVYLGFAGDGVIGQLSAPIRDDAHWHGLVGAHTGEVLPAVMWEREIDVEGTPLWLLVRSLPVQRQSPEVRTRNK